MVTVKSFSKLNGTHRINMVITATRHSIRLFIVFINHIQRRNFSTDIGQKHHLIIVTGVLFFSSRNQFRNSSGQFILESDIVHSFQFSFGQFDFRSHGFGDGNDAVPADTDSDNKADYIDTDSDNDTIPDSIEGTIDTDSDTLPNYRDTDSDGDTILDSYEAKDGNNPIDTDNDGKKDYVDTDSDNDLIPDKVEAGANPASPLNSDSDALENYRDIDSDGDKIPDTEEAGADPNNPVDTDWDKD